MRKLLLTILLVWVTSTSVSSFSQVRKVTGSLSDGLRELTSASGVSISFNPSLTQAYSVSWAQLYGGDFESSLAQLLAGTNLSFKRVNVSNYYVYKRSDSGADRAVGYSSARIRMPGRIPYKMPWVAIKTNMLYDLTSTMNLGFEFGLARAVSLDLSANYNPWVYSENRKIQHVMIQPELRFWTCERFSGHFIGVHGIWAHYNAGGLGFIPFANPWFEKNRYNGNLWGAGISYGYQWVLGKRINLEANIGVGYARLKYDRYDCRTCGRIKETGATYNYFGPTKLGLSLVVLL